MSEAPLAIAPEVEPAPVVEPAPEPPPEVVPATDVESLRAAVAGGGVELVGTENKMLSAVLIDAHPVAVAGEDLTVAFASSAAFLKKKAEHPTTARSSPTRCSRSRTSAGACPMNCSRPTLAPRPSPVPTEEEWVARFMEEFTPRGRSPAIRRR